mgnify:FL=1
MTKHTLVKLTLLLCLFFGLSQSKANAQYMYKPITGEGVQVAKVTNSGAFCVTQLCLGSNYVDLNKIIDDDVTTGAYYGSILDVLNSKGVTVKNYDTTYPAGTVTGYLFSSEQVLSLGILNGVYVSTYLNGQLQEVKSAGSLLSISILSVSNTKSYLTFTTTKPFNEVRFYTSGLAKNFLNGLKVYSAFAFSSLNPNQLNVEHCNMPIAGRTVNVSYDGPGICAACNLINADNIINANSNDFAALVTPVTILSSPSVGVLNTGGVYPAGYNAGFVVSNSDGNALAMVNILNTMSVETYLFGQKQESTTVSSGTGGGLLSLKILSFNNANRAKIGFKTSKPFNEIRFRQNFGASVAIAATKIYYAYAEPGSCTDCNIYLGSAPSGKFSGSLVANNPGFFGFGGETFNGTYGIALHSLSNVNNVITADREDYAVYTSPLIAGILAGARVSAVNNGTAFPAGTSAGYEIVQAGGLLDVNLLSGITIKTYLVSGNTKTLRESNVGNAQLLGLDILPGNSSKARVGFKTTKSFNMVQIELNTGLVTVGLGNQTRIFGAYIFEDADGDGFGDCIDLCPGDNSIDSDFDGVPDACDNCNTGSFAPRLNSYSYTNDCNATNQTTVVLPTVSEGGNPINSVVEYHTVPNPTSNATRVSNVLTGVGAYKYYVVFRDQVYNCYSVSLPVTINIKNCVLPDLQPVVQYGISEYGPAYRKIAVSIVNLNEVATNGPIAFTIQGLPLSQQLVDIQVNGAAAGNVTIEGEQFPYDNTKWNITNNSVAGQNNNYRFVSNASYSIPPSSAVTVYLTIKTHNNNFGDDVMFYVNIQPNSGGEVNNTNNGVYYQLFYDASLVGNLLNQKSSIKLVSELSVYPNPVTNQAVIAGIEAGSKIEVYNTLGQLMTSTTATSGLAAIDMSKYAAGNYLVTVTGTTGVQSVKVQKL